MSNLKRIAAGEASQRNASCSEEQQPEQDRCKPRLLIICVQVVFVRDDWRHMVQKRPDDANAVSGDVLVSAILVLDASEARLASGVIGLRAKTAISK